MSMIDSLRESVLRDNNTAQIELEGILSRMNPHTKRIQISSPLHGDLDFSVLNRFRQVEEIVIEKGEITDIKNIPDTVRILHCPNQLLIGLFDLPAKLVELHCDYNYISIFDGKKTPELTKISISNNRLEQIINIPKHLEELYCTHNKIKQLNLEGVDGIMVLHVSDNPTLVIEHIPESLVDFQSDNSPFVNRSYETDTTTHNHESNHRESAKKIDYVEALNMYIQLKRNYEQTLLKSRRDVFNNAKTKSEGKRLVKQVKPKCINCKRPVGTIFSSKDDKYTAICGNTNLNAKCSLNIQLYRGYHSDRESILYIFKLSSDKAKEAIIRQKLDTLFQYIDERTATARFKKELENYNSESGTFHDVLDDYNERYFNKSRDEKIAEKKLEISELLKQYESIIDDYKSNPDNHQLLRDAVQLHIKEITPEVENLRRLKHELTEVDTQINVTGANVYTIKSTLVQRKTTLADMDEVLSEPPDVIKFNKKQ